VCGLAAKQIKAHALFGLFEGFEFLKVFALAESVIQTKKQKK
jgi:hypothetical protein